MFVHLHTHSCYSFLEGLASPRELAKRAAELEMPSLALTDHNRLSGAIEFYDACREAGVQPILGLELDVRLPPDLLPGFRDAGAGPLTLLATGLDGWASLCRLSSVAQSDLAASQPVAFERLGQDAGGLLCLSGGLAGMAARLIPSRQGNHVDGENLARGWLERLRELFPDRLYVELQRHSREDRRWGEPLSRLATALRLPAVATHNVFYLSPDQGSLQRVVAAIRLNQTLGDLPDEASAPAGAFFASPVEMAELFVDDLAVLERTVEIAGRCRVELPLDVAHFPVVDLLPDVTPIQALREKATEGARKRYAQAHPAALLPEIQSRLEHELAVIEQCGYEALFLVMEEIVDFARQNGIPIASRGSASSSLVAHCLGITSPDPVRLNLYFERFLNPARATPPDIDTDLCSRRRDEVIDFVYRRFGSERVAMVCTINRFRRRSALRDVAKAYGLPPKEVDTLANSLPQRWYGPLERVQPDEAPFADLSARYPSVRHQAIFRDAAALLGMPRHLSIHPGGIVISPTTMTDLAPTQMATKGVVITQFDLESVERLGLVKIDLLGIRGLTVLGDVAAEQGQATAERGISAGPAASLAFLDAIPEEDQATSEMVEHGHTIGCFQIESPGMRATLKEIHARSADDILAALALYRPGPLTGGLKDAFVARYRGLEPPAYLHPALEPLLEDTHGVILYQEQVLHIAHELAGLSLADADLLRRAMSHFDPGKQMQMLKERFIAGAYGLNGVPEAVSGRIWEMMAAFAGYGFPKAHAASYARLAWQSAWCKAHHPAIFMAAVLANWGGYYGQRVYLTEARRLGLALRPPHVNYAMPEFSARWLDGRAVLFMGLNQVRDLTRRTQARILRQRPFTSLLDFLARVDPRSQEAENLARAGALEDFGTAPVVLRQLRQGGWRGGQLPLFKLDLGSDEDWTLEEKAAAQQEVLGTSIVAHPLELHAEQIAASGALSTVEAAARLGQRVRLAGMRQTWRRSRSSRGDAIYFMALEDLEGMLDVVISSDVYGRCRTALNGPGPYIIEGGVVFDAEKGEPFIRAERIDSLR